MLIGLKPPIEDGEVYWLSYWAAFDFHQLTLWPEDEFDRLSHYLSLGPST